MPDSAAVRIAQTLKDAFERGDAKLACTVYSPDIVIDAMLSRGPKRVVDGHAELVVDQERMFQLFPAPRTCTASVLPGTDSFLIEWAMRGAKSTRPYHSAAVYELEDDLVIRERMYFDLGRRS